MELPPNLALPLKEAKVDFLEVLLNRFSLSRHGQGSCLEVSFDRTTPAIRSRAARETVMAAVPDFAAKVKRYRRELEAFLVDGTGTTYEFEDPDFPFRYASGGTLPIVRFEKNEYYCFFYREIFPIGWNIANGACDSIIELLNPLYTIERELREELLILDPKNNRIYVFDWDAGKRLDQPEFAVARRFWRQKLPNKDLLDFHDHEVPLRWIDGPDLLKVRYGDAEPEVYRGCFLNINAEDFGIEIDRVAKINVDTEAVLVDGEYDEGPINAPIALLNVDRTNDELADGVEEFVPDVLFLGGERYDGRSLHHVVHELFIPEIAKRLRPEQLSAFEKADRKFDLCPVTRSIVGRCRPLAESGEGGDGCDVFISFGSEDEELARAVYRVLRAEGRRVFFSEDTLHQANFSRAIDEALEDATCLIAVCTDPAHLLRPWPEYEWRSFHVDLNNGRKSKRATLFAVVAGCDPADLPRPLRQNEALKCDPRSPEAGLRDLLQRVP